MLFNWSGQLVKNILPGELELIFFWLCECVYDILPVIYLSDHSACIHFWYAALNPVHQETLLMHWWTACMPPVKEREEIV